MTSDASLMYVCSGSAYNDYTCNKACGTVIPPDKIGTLHDAPPVSMDGPVTVPPQHRKKCVACCCVTLLHGMTRHQASPVEVHGLPLEGLCGSASASRRFRRLSAHCTKDAVLLPMLACVCLSAGVLSHECMKGAES